MKNLLLNSTNPVCIINESGDTLKVSDNWLTVFTPFFKKNTQITFQDINSISNFDLIEYAHKCLVGDVIHSPAIRFFDLRFQEFWFEFLFLPTTDQLAHTLVIATDVSERERQNHLLLKASEIAQIGCWEINTINQAIFWDEETTKIHETPSDFIPTYENTIDFFKGEYKDRIDKYIKEAIIYGIPFDEEIEIVSYTKQVIPIRIVGKPEFHEGNCIRILGIMQVIKNQTILKQNLEQSKKTFKDAFEFSGIGMAIVSPNGKWLNVNKKVQEILGFTKEELTLLTFQDITYYEDLDLDLDLLDQLVRGEISSYEMKKRYHHKNGSLVWAKLSVSIVRNDDGSVKHFISQIQDITREIEFEKEIQDQKEKFWTVFNSSYQFTALLNANGILLEINEAALNFGKVSRDEVIMKPLWKTTWWKYDVINAEKLKKNILLASVGETIRYDVQVMDGDGQMITVDFSLKPVIDTEKKVIYILAEARIIEDYIQALKKIGESESKFRTLFELSPVGFILSDLQTGEIKDINQSIVRNTLFSREKILQMKFKDLVPREHYPTLSQIETQLSNKGYFDSIEIEYLTSKNSTFPAIVDGVITEDKQGNKLIWSVIQNISELKENQARLYQLNEEIKEKNAHLFRSNEELEQFASIASHDLQEPLRMISSFISLIDSKYGVHFDDKGKRYIQFVLEGAARMRLLIHNLLAYSKVSNDFSKAEWVDLNDIFAEIQSLIREPIIEIQPLPIVMGQKTPLFHLFKNIVQNGIKYQKSGSIPIIRVNYLPAEKEDIISISDNGIGIEEDSIEQIFHLFSRLHNQEEYEGSGIGLALCKKIMDRHNGRIWVESEVGKGSIFYCSFPK